MSRWLPIHRAYVGAGLVAEGASETDLALALDPQTSGLLVALPMADAQTMVAAGRGVVVGRVLAGEARVTLA